MDFCKRPHHFMTGKSNNIIAHCELKIQKLWHEHSKKSIKCQAKYFEYKIINCEGFVHNPAICFKPSDAYFNRSAE